MECFAGILNPKVLPRKYPKVLPQEGEGLPDLFSSAMAKGICKGLLPCLKLQCSGTGHSHQTCSLVTEDSRTVYLLSE